MADTAERRADAAAARSRALRSGILGSLGVRAVALVAPLILIPINLTYLGPALFGLWSALTAITAVTTFSDLGMGNGLLTLLPKALADGDEHTARSLVSSAYALLIAVSLGVLVALTVTFPFVPWESVFDPERTLDPGGVRLVVAAALAVTAVAAPLGLNTRLYYATQRGHVAAFWTSAVILAPVPPALIGIWLGASPFAIVVVLVGAGALTQLVATMWFFTRTARELRPSFRMASRGHVRRLFRLGGLFLALSVALMLSTSLDNLILTHSVGLAAVAAFAVPAKVFMQLSQAVTLANLPLWAAHGDAMARGDLQWVSRATRRMVAFSTGAAALAGAFAVVAGPPLIHLWLGQDVPLPTPLMVGLAAATVVTAALSPLFMMLNAASSVVPQIIAWGSFALLTLPAKYLATSAWGYEVLPWVTVLGLLLLVTPPTLVATRRALRTWASRVPA